MVVDTKDIVVVVTLMVDLEVDTAAEPVMTKIYMEVDTFVKL
jgi:hypothetical protein